MRPRAWAHNRLLAIPLIHLLNFANEALLQPLQGRLTTLATIKMGILRKLMRLFRLFLN